MYVLGEREGGNSSYGPHATEAGMLAVYPVLLELVFDSEKEGHNGPGDGDAYGKCEKLTKCTSICDDNFPRASPSLLYASTTGHCRPLSGGRIRIPSVSITDTTYSFE